MAEDLKNLNKERTEEYRKSTEQENFLEDLNRTLHKKEIKEYQAYPIQHPFLFIIGLPRSGTTLFSQFLAHTFDIGFFNNIAARFYKAPLHGIRLSEILLNDKNKTDFRSNYAKTGHLSDIHEFGYFWRHWLKKESLNDIANYLNKENEIDWVNLKQCLSSIQNEFGKGLIAKNIFGSYHMPKLADLLGTSVFLLIERDELDVACSILDARKKYYGSKLDKWWSYAPPEVLDLISLDHQKQIAGQIYYLSKFYNSELKKLSNKHYLKISYQELCNQPEQIALKVQKHVIEHFDYKLEICSDIPSSFPFKTHQNRTEERNVFESLIKEFGVKT